MHTSRRYGAGTSLSDRRVGGNRQWPGIRSLSDTAEVDRDTPSGNCPKSVTGSRGVRKPSVGGFGHGRCRGVALRVHRGSSPARRTRRRTWTLCNEPAALVRSPTRPPAPLPAGRSSLACSSDCWSATHWSLGKLDRIGRSLTHLLATGTDLAGFRSRSLSPDDGEGPRDRFSYPTVPRLAAICRGSPVAGLRPSRAARLRASNVPNPAKMTFSPVAVAAMI